MTGQLRIAFFGSSLVSAYWNGAATYYRGLIEALHHLGHKITFYEPDAFDRQKHRDLDGVPYARSVVYSPEIESMRWCLDEARAADVVVKGSESSRSTPTPSVPGRSSSTFARTIPTRCGGHRMADPLDLVVRGLTITSSWGNGHLYISRR